MIFVGDLFQLPPVVADREEAKTFADRWESPYFFSAHVLKEIDMEVVELTKIYRQTDQDLIDLLSSLRENKCDGDFIERLNRRHQPEFSPGENECFITLTTTNALAADINEKRLDSLAAEKKEFKGRVEGSFNTQDMPNDLTLYLKQNAQVMFVKNDKDILVTPVTLLRVPRPATLGYAFQGGLKCFAANVARICQRIRSSALNVVWL